jgi:CRISPR-associated protein Csx10
VKQIDLFITAQSPLAIGRQKPGGSVSEADSYIPGIVIRGALAGRLLQTSTNSNQRDFRTNGGDFQSLFLGENPAIFRNAYPVKREKDTDFPEIRLLPSTAVSSKNDPGFLKSNPRNDEEQRCGVFDTLIDRFCAESVGHPYDPSSPKDPEDRIEPFSGFYTVTDKRYKSQKAAKRLLTRVGINRRRSTAEDNLLYSLEVLSEVEEGKDTETEQKPTCFRGSIIMSDDKIASKLAAVIKDADLRLGGSTSRGLGKVAIDAVCGKPKSDFSLRFQDFNSGLHTRLKTWQSIFSGSNASTPKNRHYFTVDLQSDAIFLDRWRRTMVLTAQMLQDATEVNDETLKLHVSYASSSLRSGWNAAWGLMKDVELITNSGAVYLFSTENPSLWQEALQNLEYYGIGERTSEGFGQVQISNEFHLVFREASV